MYFLRKQMLCDMNVMVIHEATVTGLWPSAATSQKHFLQQQHTDVRVCIQTLNTLNEISDTGLHARASFAAGSLLQPLLLLWKWTSLNRWLKQQFRQIHLFP